MRWCLIFLVACGSSPSTDDVVVSMPCDMFARQVQQFYLGGAQRQVRASSCDSIAWCRKEQCPSGGLHMMCLTPTDCFETGDCNAGNAMPDPGNINSNTIQMFDSAMGLAIRVSGTNQIDGECEFREAIP